MGPPIASELPGALVLETQTKATLLDLVAVKTNLSAVNSLSYSEIQFEMI